MKPDCHVLGFVPHDDRRKWFTHFLSVRLLAREAAAIGG